VRRVPLASGVLALSAAVVGLAAVQDTPARAPRAERQEPSGPQTAGRWELVVLGIAQDGGMPHLGCTQELCQSMREGRRKPERVASVGLVNRALGKAYMIDATPDFVSQIGSLTGGRLPDGIFLTHAHVGHYTGLMYLGRESVDATGVPVYATDRMTKFLRANEPWAWLGQKGNIALKPLVADTAVDLGNGLKITPFTVPHRDEFSDTVGFLIEGPTRKALYIPDIDQWPKWTRRIRDVAAEVDLAFLDGTFASADEIPGRKIADIPHPLIPVTRDLLQGVKARVWFIHLNHTNSQIDAPDVVRDGLRFPM
jgi:pyrroloquinoline quinone biosynthesis protein B